MARYTNINNANAEIDRLDRDVGDLADRWEKDVERARTAEIAANAMRPIVEMVASLYGGDLRDLKKSDILYLHGSGKLTVADVVTARGLVAPRTVVVDGD